VGRGSVLTLAFWPTHFRDVLAPVLREMAPRVGESLAVVAEEALSLGLAPARFASIWQYWDAVAAAAVRTNLGRQRAVARALRAPGGLEELLRREELPFSAPVVRRLLLARLRKEFRRLARIAALAARILEGERPRLVIYSDDSDPRCRVFSLQAAQRNVPTLLVQQGIASAAYPEWKFFSAGTVAAMGPTSREAMVSQGVAPGRIVLTGNPGFDRLVVRAPEEGAAVRRRLGLDQDRRMLLFASQPYRAGAFRSPEARSEMIAAIGNAMRAVPEVQLVAKAHPAEDPRELAQLLGPGLCALLGPGEDIIPLIKASDIFMTFFSQTALQALCAGKPVLNVAFPGAGGMDLYERSGATWVARNEREIMECLRRLAGAGAPALRAGREAARREFVRAWAQADDGRAAARTAQLAFDRMATSES